VRRGSSIASVLLLAGCASTPADTRSTEPYKFTSSRPPAAVAQCLIDNGENFSGNFAGFGGSMRDRKGVLTVTLRNPHTGNGVIADITPTGTGSNATVWISRGHLFPGSLFSEIRAGC
jgi:hypothetical protein